MSIDGRILVTGATGFIGRPLVARLLAEGARVRALALPSEKVEGLWPGGVEVMRGDVADRARMGAAARGAGTVVHLAAVVSDWGDEALYRRITVEGTRNVLEQAAPGTRVVLASSVVVYADAIGRDECDEDHPFGRALGAYGRSKQVQELLARTIAAARGLRLTVMRPVNVYGPGSKPWVHDAATQLKSGRPTLVSGGRQNAGLCHVTNAVEAFALAASRPEAVGRTYNVCDGSDITWRRYFTDLAKMVGAPPPTSIPWAVAKAGAYAYEAFWKLLRRKTRPALTHEALNLVGSNHRVPIDRARRELGYHPLVEYDEGIRTVSEYVAKAAR